MKKLTEQEQKKLFGGYLYTAECRMQDFDYSGVSYKKVKEKAINHCLSKGYYGPNGHRYSIY